MIDSFDFGRIVVDGKNYEDVKIIGDKVINWQYVEHHTVIKQDVIEIFEDNPEIVVIGTGVDGLVHIQKEVIKFASEKGIELVIESTKKACEVYNRLKKEGKKVNAIIHSTC